MAFQTIGAENKHDIFYRYKMPSLITKIEGRGNGIKTNVVNMVDIAKALGRPASYTTKYFGCELGAQSKFDEKTGTAFVNGSHETSKLADLLEKFIKKFVQCYTDEGKGDKGKGDKIEGGCGNPETEIIITKSQMIKLKCAACGHLSKVDMRDKLTTFIIKNPPESKKGPKDKKSMRRAEKERLKEGEAADEDLKKLKKEAVKKLGSSKEKATSKNQSPTHSQADKHEKVPAGAEDSDDDVEWQTDTSSVAAQQTIQQQLNAVTANMVMLSADEEEKPKPVKPKTNGESESEQLVAAIKEFIKKGSPASQLKPFLESLTGPRQEIVDVLFEALFEGVGKGFSKEAVKKKKYIAAVVDEDGSQLLLLHAIEVFCHKASPEAAKEVALVLKALYDDDVLEEEFIVEWYEKGFCGSNKSLLIWKNVKPFVEWLQSAESESEEE